MSEENPYCGQPTEKRDHAWHELLAGMNIRVSGEELSTNSKTSLPIVDGKGGYYVTLGKFALGWVDEPATDAEVDVYHQLHCLKYLRQINYREYYDVKHVKLDHVGKFVHVSFLDNTTWPKS